MGKRAWAKDKKRMQQQIAKLKKTEKTTLKKDKKKAQRNVKKEKKKLRKEKKMEKKAPKARGRGCPMCKKCSPKRKSFKVGDKKYLYVKFKKKYLGCRVKSAFAVKNYDRVKQLASKYKKQKWLC